MILLYHAVKIEPSQKFMHFYLDESRNCTQNENPSKEFPFNCVAYVVFNDHHMGLLAAMPPQDSVKTMMINNLKENTIRGF